ncbi:hypothetical protein RvY_03059 [Ramazzottius varieornatus]|uniref:Uncharacterized protein n=1 Tax=Ramazzottius varieornatus TaxID=947166 RepID=A0A1D1ULS5_RAMVA|nr:hypothetical protein RvY_03059 [Ramazzottius varieornatus]
MDRSDFHFQNVARTSYTVFREKEGRSAVTTATELATQTILTILVHTSTAVADVRTTHLGAQMNANADTEGVVVEEVAQRGRGKRMQPKPGIHV